MKLSTQDHKKAVRADQEISNPYSGDRKLLPLLATIAVILVMVGLSSCAGYTSAAKVGGTGGGTPGSPGTGVLSPNLSSLAFGNVAMGSTGTQSVTVTNTGTGAVSISSSMIAGAAFTVIGGNPASSLAVGQSETVQIQFAPTATGAATGTFTITSDASNSPLAISLSGTGMTGGGLAANPASENFGSVAVGSTGTVSITLSNTGTSAVSITAHSIAGTGFALTGWSAPASLNAGQTTTFTVTFAPTTAGAASGSVSVTSDAPGSPLTIALSGTGSQAQISANPASVAFGNVVVGNSNSQPIKLQNNGNATLTFSKISMAGTGMTVTGLSTSTTIVAGGNVSFNAVFTPTAATTVNGSITLATNGTPSPLTINLSGTGVTATQILTANPTSLVFGTVNVNSSSQLTSTLTNNGNSNVVVSGVTVTGAGFSASGVSNGTTLTPGQSVTLTVTFAPASAGAVNGASVSIASNATGSPTTIALSGTGQAVSSHSVALSWTASVTTGVNAYNVFRATTSGGYGPTPLNPSPVATTNYTDTNVVSGQQYFYVVTALDAGVSSADSKEISVTIP
jgi:centrosomal CEP192-like protein/ASPM-SPD-2-Hydin domain-containing protein